LLSHRFYRHQRAIGIFDFGAGGQHIGQRAFGDQNAFALF